MALSITPVGEYENAFFYFSGTFFWPSVLGRDSGYYGVLARKQPKEIVDRVATLYALSTDMRIASADWNFSRQVTPKESQEAPDAGVSMSHEPFGEWHKDVSGLAAMLISARAIPKRHLARITNGLKRSGKKNELGLRVDPHAHQYLCRLLHQIRTSLEFDSKLLVTDSDRDLIVQIGTFMAAQRWPTPFPIPDLRSSIQAEGETFGILLINAPDFESVMSVKANREVREYTKVLEQYISMPPAERERKMVEAMRGALDREGVAKHTKFVFEVQTWVWRALHFVHEMSAIASLGELVAELAKTWAEREQKKAEWYAIGPRMTQLAIKDYLKRKGNL